MKKKTAKEKTLYKSGYSDVNGIKMYYEIHGSTGNHLVLIHGGGSTIGTSFGKILPFLANDYRVVAVELQAHGHTGGRNSSESFEQDADDVVELLNNLQISRTSFLGFSNGGNTAMVVARRYPQIVDKLILSSTFYKREGLQPGFFEGMERASINDMPAVLREAFLQINPDTRSLLTMFNKDRERMLQFKNWNDEDLGSIKAPTLIISGDQDVVQPTHAIEMWRLIPNSRLMILPSDHGSYLGAAESKGSEAKIFEITVEIIKDFLKD